jgi:hypothetical protein
LNEQILIDKGIAKEHIMADWEVRHEFLSKNRILSYRHGFNRGK